MSKTGVDKLVWAEFQRQLDLNNLKIKKGMIQDAIFSYVD